jgi:hypothetical protein
MSSVFRVVTPRCAIVALLVSVSLATAGCGGKGDVTGKVSYNGQPLPYGNVQFQSANGSVHIGDIQPDGTYTIKGVPTGSVKISVTCMDPAGVEFAKQMSAASKDPSNAKAKPTGKLEDFNKIPGQYNDFSTSELTFDIKSGTQTHNIDLK